MPLIGFMRLMILPEFTWVVIREPVSGAELASGFADDLIERSMLFLQNFDLISYYVDGHGLTINVRRKENKI